MFSLIAIGFALDRAVSMNGVSGPPATPEELEALVPDVVLIDVYVVVPEFSIVCRTVFIVSIM